MLRDRGRKKNPLHLFTEYERRVLPSKPSFFEHEWIIFPTLSLAHFQESHIGKIFKFLSSYFPFPFTFFSFLLPFPSFPFSSFLLGTGKEDYVEKYLYSYPLIGSRMFCHFSVKDSERQRGNCVALMRAALLSHWLICVQSRAEIHLCGNEVCTDLHEANGHHLTCSQAHLQPPGWWEGGYGGPAFSPDRDEQELAQGTMPVVLEGFVLWKEFLQGHVVIGQGLWF